MFGKGYNELLAEINRRLNGLEEQRGFDRKHDDGLRDRIRQIENELYALRTERPEIQKLLKRAKAVGFEANYDAQNKIFSVSCEPGHLYSRTWHKLKASELTSLLDITEGKKRGKKEKQ